MTRDEAVAVVQRGLTFRSTGTTAIISALQQAQRVRELKKDLPWFLLEEDFDLAGTANNPHINLPADWIKFAEDEDVSYFLNGVFVGVLEKAEWNQLQKVWKNTSRTTPFAYALRNGRISVAPTPTSNYLLRASYYKKAVVLSSNVENVWLLHAPDVLIADAGLIAAADLQHDEAIQKFAAMKVDADRALLEAMTEHEWGTAGVTMGGNN